PRLGRADAEPERAASAHDADAEPRRALDELALDRADAVGLADDLRNRDCSRHWPSLRLLRPAAPAAARPARPAPRLPQDRRSRRTSPSHSTGPRTSPSARAPASAAPTCRSTTAAPSAMSSRSVASRAATSTTATARVRGSRRRSPIDRVTRASATRPVMREVHELLWLLTEAGEMCPERETGIHADVVAAINDLDAVATAPMPASMAADVQRQAGGVHQLLRKVGQRVDMVAAPACSPSPEAANQCPS